MFGKYILRILLSFFIVSTSIVVVHGQGARSFNPEEAQQHQLQKLYDAGNYVEAIPLLEELMGYRVTDDRLYMLARCYAYTDSYDKAVANYERLLSTNENYDATAYYEMAFCMMESGNYKNAIPALEKYLAKVKDYPRQARSVHRARYKLAYAQHAISIGEFQNNTAVLPLRLSDSINTRYPEYLPMLNPTGKILYFTADKIGGISEELSPSADFDEDLFYVEKENGRWSSPQLMPEPINSRNNDGAASFSADGQTMVYGACGRDDGVGSCDLYISYLNGNKWTQPVNMGDVVNSSAWDAHSTISSDGTRIIFASNRSGGYGGTDLYMTEMNVFGEWSVPVNLGGIVNTPFEEASPFISQDGKTLYFSSDGHPGYGGDDIFKTVFEEGRWSLPINLQRPVNTKGDDKYFTIGGSGELGYFASDRDGNLDLYEIAMPEEMRPQPTIVVAGVVTNAKNGEPAAAFVLVEDLNTGELIAVNKSNSVTGKYLIVLPAGRTYAVSANREGFFFYSQVFDVPASAAFAEMKKDIALQPIEKGARVVLNNIFFESGKATLSPQSKLELDKAVDMLKKNQSMIVEVGGHTDNVGDDARNMSLSHERARAVREHIIQSGILPQRVQAKGYGELNPIASNDSPEGRQANRRTEFIILEF